MKQFIRDSMDAANKRESKNKSENRDKLNEDLDIVDIEDKTYNSPCVKIKPKTKNNEEK
jgi:hypothetical protein